MRKVVRTSLLVLALSCPAYAGDITNNVAGEMPFPAPQSAPATPDTVREEAGGHIPNNRPAGETVMGVLLSLLRVAVAPL